MCVSAIKKKQKKKKLQNKSIRKYSARELE